MNRDEIMALELLGRFKEAIYEILEEADGDRDWDVVITACQDALEQLED
jgi:hypothetical protein